MPVNEMVFMMGLPASGKSTQRARFTAHDVIDPDLIKAAHPAYDPKNCQALHEWSMWWEERAFNVALALAAGRWIVDGTGTNAEKMVRRMTQAKAAGFTVRLVYVRVSLATALQRNAARQRNVPEYVLKEKALNIATSFELVAPHADSVEVIDNDPK